MPSLVGTSRIAVSITLGFLCALFLTIAAIRTWMSDAIYDDDRFAGTAVRVMEREDVRAEVRQSVVDLIVRQQPELVSARPIIETVVDTAIRSKAFESIMAEAARDLHRTVFETDRQSLILNLSDMMTIAVAGVRAYDPELADRLPGGPNTAAIELATRSTATRVAEVDRRLAALRWVFLGVAAACGAGSVLVGDSLRRSVATVGISLVACAIAVWLAIGVVATIIEREVGQGEVAGEAAAAAWRMYADGLVWWMWLQALGGLVLAVVATNLGAPSPISRRMAIARERWDAAWSNQLTRTVAAGGIATLGLLLMISPESTLRVAAQSAGLILLYLGAGELLRGLGIARVRAPQAEPAPQPSRSSVLVPRLLASGGLMAAVLFASVVFWVNRDSLRAQPASAIPPIESCNGMEELCDRRLDEVVFAATHNSMSAAESPGWYFAEQMRTIPRQLDDGVRAFLIDVYYGYATNRGVRTDPEVGSVVSRLEPWFGPEALDAAYNLANAYGPIPDGAQPALYLCHGFCELGATAFDQAMSDLGGFLRDNPHEVVILFLQDYVDPFDVQASFERTRLIDYVYTIVPETPLPTLREMIELDRRVLVLSENLGTQEAPAWYHDGFALVQDTPYSFRTVEAFACTAFRGDAESPLFLINHWLSRSTPSPTDAEGANSFDVLYDRARRCQEERGRLPNLIAVNFYETGDLIDVVDALNSEPFPEPEDEDEDEAEPTDDGAAGR